MPSITISLSNAAAIRLQDALAESLGLVDDDGKPRRATAEETKKYIIADLKQIIGTSERRAAAAATAVTRPKPTIT